MTTLGIIADTHGWLDPAIAEHFAACDAILLAGDIGGLAVVEALRRIAPTHAVRGNNDESNDCASLPGCLTLDFKGTRIGLSHFEREAVAAGEIAVFGHSHRAVWDPLGPVARLNPGAAGRRGFHIRRSVALLSLTHGAPPAVAFVDLGARSSRDTESKPLC